MTGFNDTVNSATNAVIESLQNEAATQVGNIRTAGDGVKEYVDGVVNIAKQEITSSKNAAVESVENAGSAAIGEVDTAKNVAMETISNAAEEINNIKTQADTTAALALQQANAAMNEVAAVENTVNDVKSGFESMEAILGTKVDGGYVENDSLYLTSNGEVVAGPFTGFGGSGTGGGGGGSTNSAVLTVTNATGWVSSTIASGASCLLSIEWSSIEDGLSTGNGSLTIKVGGVVKAILDIAQGLFSTDIGEYLSAGNNSIQLQVMDSYGNSRVKNFTVTVVELGYAEFVYATKLQQLILGNPSQYYKNGNLQTLYLGKNKLLKKLDVRNCTGLGTGDQKTVDLSGCTGIEEVYFDGTKITGVTLPNGGALRILHLPSTITSLIIRNQSAIEDFSCPSLASISTLWLENVGSGVDTKAILESLSTGARVRLFGFRWELEEATQISDMFDILDDMRGIDQNGDNMPTAQVYGTIYVPNVTGDVVAHAKERYPDIAITYDHV